MGNYPQGDGCCIVLEGSEGGTQMPKSNDFYVPTLGRILPLPQMCQLLYSK